MAMAWAVVERAMKMQEMIVQALAPSAAIRALPSSSSVPFVHDGEALQPRHALQAATRG